MFWLIAQLLVIGTLLYFYINRKYSYWSSRGIPGPRPIYPFGFTLEKTLTPPDVYELGNVRKYGKIYGVYTGTLPTLTIAEPELIKQVLVKDFQHYPNRRVLNPYNPVWNKNMANLESHEWKRIRSISTPAFSSIKLKQMYPLMNVCIDKLVEYLDSKTAATGLINTKEVMAGFAIDVIASTAFATETRANSDSTKKSPFVHHGTNIFNVSPFKVASVMILPRFILRLLGFTIFFNEKSFHFFIDLTRKIVQRRRKETDVKRNDLVQLMMDTYTTEEEIKSTNYDKLTINDDNDELTNETAIEKPSVPPKAKKMLDEDEIVGQSVLFFFAGFETTAATLSFCIFELAHRPEIQERLAEEMATISTQTDTSNIEVYFDKLINHAPYLDAVIKETLRRYPNVVRLERRVETDGIKLGGIPLDKGVLVEVPIMAVHHNPDYYPDPETFNPDRFLPENKHLLEPYTFLPFGDGPRNCVGMRFAFQEIKLCLARIIQRYRFSLTPETPSKLTFAKGAQLLITPPFHVKISTR